MVEIQNEDDFKAWLFEKPHDFAALLAARAALRVLPPVGRWRPVKRSEIKMRNNWILLSLRAAAIPIIAAKFSGNRDQLQSAARIASKAGNGAATAATAAASAFASDNPIDAAGISVKASATYAAELEKEIWRSIEIDARYLEQEMNMENSLINLPLWINFDRSTTVEMNKKFSIPSILVNEWEHLKDDLVEANEDWEVWTSWYERLLSGSRTYSKDVELFRVLLNNEADWGKGPAHVNALIKSLIQGELGEQGVQPILNPPSNQTAAIEPEIVRGKVTVPRRKAKGGLKGADLIAALAALKSELAELSGDLSNVPNIDIRPALYLQQLAKRIPDDVPTQAELFRIAHAREIIQRYSEKVAQEWPEHFAVSYQALCTHFDRTVRQFPNWKKFIDNAAKEADQLPERDSVVVAADAVLNELRSEEGLQIVDTSTISEIEALETDYTIQNETIAQEETSIKDTKMTFFAVDFIASLSNVLARIFEVIGSSLQAVKNKIQPHIEILGESFSEELKRKERNFGPWVFKWASRLVIGVLSAFSISSMVAGAVSTAGVHIHIPHALRWLEAWLPYLT